MSLLSFLQVFSHILRLRNQQFLSHVRCALPFRGAGGMGDENQAAPPVNQLERTFMGEKNRHFHHLNRKLWSEQTQFFHLILKKKWKEKLSCWPFFFSSSFKKRTRKWRATFFFDTCVRKCGLLVDSDPAGYHLTEKWPVHKSAVAINYFSAQPVMRDSRD